jgi:hypothetical protein
MMMLTLVLLLSPVLTGRDIAQPKTPNVEGRVLIEGTSAPLAGALVSIPGVSRSRTDEQGRFALHDVPAGNYNLVVSRKDYIPLVQPISVIEGFTTKVEVALTPIPSREAPSDRRGNRGAADSPSPGNVHWWEPTPASGSRLRS